MFEPLNTHIICVIVSLLVFFHLFGSLVVFLTKGKKWGTEDRLFYFSYWLIGLCIFGFIWFIIGFVVSPTAKSVLSSLFIFSTFIVFCLAKFNNYRIFVFPRIKDIGYFALILLVFSPFFKSIFIYASQPPHFSDELTYHILAPPLFEQKIDWMYNFVREGFYVMLPKNLNLFYIISFALTKTYSLARFVNFLIFFTSILTLVKIISHKYNLKIGILFPFLVLGISTDFSFRSTLLMIDIPTLGMLVLSVGATFYVISSSKYENLPTVLALWGCAAGTKYSVIVSLGFSAIVLLYSYLRSYNWKTDVLKKSAFLFFICGGFWYVKNLLVTGNPIYPFVFPCFNFEDLCNESRNVFAGWTVKVSFSNLYNILLELLNKIDVLLYLFLGSSIIGLILFFKGRRFFSIFFLSILIFELLVINKLSGFYPRYHEYLYFYMVLQIVVIFSELYTLNNKRSAKVTVGLAVLLGCYFFYKDHYENNHIVDFKKVKIGHFQEYWKGKIDFESWLEIEKPKAHKVYKWCEGLPNQIKVTRLDPELSWSANPFDIDKYSTKCITDFHFFPKNLKESEFKDFVFKNKLIFYNFSSVNCYEDHEQLQKALDKWPLEIQKNFIRLNQFVVCNGEKISDIIYKVDYTKF